MATKSATSSGSQHNAKGVTQGVSLVDPKTGLPVTVIDDAGVKRIAVDAKLTATVANLDVELDYNNDSVTIGDDASGNKLAINVDGSISANVEVDAADGDNIRIVGTEDGTPSGTQHSAKIDSSKNLHVTDTQALAKLLDLDISLSSIDTKLTSPLSVLSKTSGAVGLKTTRTPVGTTPVLLVAAALTDRAGLIIKNVSQTATLTVAESFSQCTAAGYPLFPREALSIDVSAGQQIWGVSTEAASDTAIMEAGG